MAWSGTGRCCPVASACEASVNLPKSHALTSLACRVGPHIVTNYHCIAKVARDTTKTLVCPRPGVACLPESARHGRYCPRMLPANSKLCPTLVHGCLALGCC